MTATSIPPRAPAPWSPQDLIEEAARRAQCPPEEVEWYSWPQAFSSTAGPRGIGGQTVTPHQVYAFDTPGLRLKWCAGQWKAWDGEVRGRW